MEGRNTHYHWHNLQRRYFLEMAKSVNYSTDTAAIILEEMLWRVESVIDLVSKTIPKEFPKSISQPIFDGIWQAKQKLEKSEII